MGNLICEFTIPGRLDGLNEYTKSCRGNKYAANALKKLNQNIVIEACRRTKAKAIGKYPVRLEITWYEPNLRRDIDNVTMGVKFILDALVKDAILIDDSPKFVRKISHEVDVDREKPRIEVKIFEI